MAEAADVSRRSLVVSPGPTDSALRGERQGGLTRCGPNMYQQAKIHERKRTPVNKWRDRIGLLMRSGVKNFVLLVH
jgi:hypothetical protein